MLTLSLTTFALVFHLTVYHGVLGVSPHKKGHPYLDIIGGNSTNISQHIYQVSIWSGTDLRGSGAIVDQGWVLTTASTVMGFDAKSLKVRIHSSDSEDGGVVYSIIKVLKHPMFRSNTMKYDVALLRLQFLLNQESMTTAEFGETSLGDNAKGTLSGWGSTSNSTKMSNQLQQVSTWTVNRQTCQQVYGDDFVIGPSQLCVIGDNVFGPCWGDNGDLLVSGGKLYGLLSWNRGCFSEAEPSVFTDVVLLKPWILRTIRKHHKKSGHNRSRHLHHARQNV